MQQHPSYTTLLHAEDDFLFFYQGPSHPLNAVVLKMWTKWQVIQSTENQWLNKVLKYSNIKQFQQSSTMSPVLYFLSLSISAWIYSYLWTYRYIHHWMCLWMTNICRWHLSKPAFHTARTSLTGWTGGWIPAEMSAHLVILHFNKLSTARMLLTYTQ